MSNFQKYSLIVSLMALITKNQTEAYNHGPAIILEGTILSLQSVHHITTHIGLLLAWDD